ncbi:hypothetical protein DPMN_031418 [Dreissena polymorpha]|uniref:Uncharacterized protein n=1 Tax=Dreissena polymorpha TaxID=45954 RepID=A0A9D4RH36_DREPO|nr:hypothetical protein DPMN_031418 [Dreissena polymorpha]
MAYQPDDVRDTTGCCDGALRLGVFNDLVDNSAQCGEISIRFVHDRYGGGHGGNCCTGC